MSRKSLPRKERGLRIKYNLPVAKRRARKLIYKAYSLWRDHDPEHLTWHELEIETQYRTKEEMPDALGKFGFLKGAAPYKHLIEVRDNLGYVLDHFVQWHEVIHYVICANDLSSLFGYHISASHSAEVEALCDGFATAMMFWALAEVEVLTHENKHEFLSLGADAKSNNEVHFLQAHRIIQLASQLPGESGERLRKLGADLLCPQ